MRENCNVLITTIGRRTYLVDYFKKALAGAGKVYVTNSEPDVPAFEIADGAVVPPLIYDEDYIPFLLDFCVKKEIGMLFSVFDLELPVLAKNIDKFTAIGTKVMVSSYDTVTTCNDKWKSYQKLLELGIGTPKTYPSLEEAEKALESGELNYPVLIKPRWGTGTMSTFEAEDAEELRVLYDKCKRDIFKSYLKYESGQDQENCVLIQEKVKGQEYGLDLISDLEEHYLHTVVKKKMQMRGSETDCAFTVDEPELRDIGRRISKGLPHVGNMDVDVMCDGASCYVIDMNARIGGGYPFSHVAGIDLPRLMVKWAKGEETDMSLLQERIGVKARKDIAIYVFDK
ncbi:MAG: ATP-grasp domain-containing protein [Lachnospiraceae bacterium]|nr:ATP-grasp domain-containing protein [Lachnospiraceae bacterium]